MITVAGRMERGACFAALAGSFQFSATASQPFVLTVSAARQPSSGRHHRLAVGARSRRSGSLCFAILDRHMLSAAVGAEHILAFTGKPCVTVPAGTSFTLIPCSCLRGKTVVTPAMRRELVLGRATMRAALTVAGATPFASAAAHEEHLTVDTGAPLVIFITAEGEQFLTLLASQHLEQFLSFGHNRSSATGSGASSHSAKHIDRRSPSSKIIAAMSASPRRTFLTRCSGSSLNRQRYLSSGNHERLLTSSSSL